VLERLQVAPELRDIPVIALTGTAPETRSGRVAAFSDYLIKPVTARALMTAIRRALDASSDESDSPALWSGGKVLIVDDTPVNLAIAEKQLSKLDIPCDTFQDPVQALEKLKAGDYAAALVDVGMPVLDGMELTRRLRASERKSGAYTPVIALTADDGRESEVARYRKGGMDGQLTKPIKLKELALTLHRWVAPSGDRARPASAKTRASSAGQTSRHG
jgi:CheY-like chemotaxis protein